MLTTRCFTGLQQLDGIVAGDNRVGRVVLHAEVLAFGYRVQQFEEDIHLLREFGIAPKAVFIMILQAEDDAVFARDRQHLLNALDHPFQTLLAGDIRVALPAEHAADGARAAEQPGDADHLGFMLDCALAPRRGRDG